MQCFSPVSGWQTEDGGIVFREVKNSRELQLRCGRCIGCRLNAANAWAIRCVHEAQCHENNAFVTLTYDDAHLPQYGSLHYPDFQKFMKRLRKKLGPVRFYMCGEYGENFTRPHYHALLFGCRFSDQIRANSVYSQRPIFRSPTLEKLWPLGHSSVGEVNQATAQYVAKYALKKVYGDTAAVHYTRLDPYTGEIWQVEPEFARMSLKPGIGWNWFEKYGQDIWNNDSVVLNGIHSAVPKYYDKIMVLQDEEKAEELKMERVLKSQQRPFDDSRERLEAKAKVAAARVNHYTRKTL